MKEHNQILDFEQLHQQIVDKYEFSPLNKMERAISNEMIKEICIPVKVVRLGNIVKLGKSE